MTEPGTIRLPSGEEHPTPSAAATAAADLGSVDGWIKWRVRRLGDVRLSTMRDE